MSTYRRLRRFAVAFLALEFVVGFGGALTSRGEIFPFASWFLFLLVPYRVTDYDLIIHARNGRPVEPPLSFSDAEGIVSDPHSVACYQLIQQLGRAEERHDASRRQIARRQIELHFASPRVEYELVRETFDPVDRQQTGRVGRRESLQTFTAGQP